MIKPYADIPELQEGAHRRGSHVSCVLPLETPTRRSEIRSWQSLWWSDQCIVHAMPKLPPPDLQVTGCAVQAPQSLQF